jgi:hypothetical protein
MRLERVKFVTCVLPHGRGLPLVHALKRDKSISSANVHHARGVGRSTPIGRWALGESGERDMLQVVVPEERADEIFEYLYFPKSTKFGKLRTCRRRTIAAAHPEVHDGG